MTTDAATGAGLLAAILDPANHGDDALRLVYADWLEEQGEGARGEFIRVQVALAGLPQERRGGLMTWGSDEAAADALRSEDPRVERLRRRERELLAEHFVSWMPAFAGFRSGYLLPSAPVVRLRRDERFDYDTALTFCRGFVSEVTCTLADWYGGLCARCGGTGLAAPNRDSDCLACTTYHDPSHLPGHGPALVRACPLSRVTLSDREPNGDGLGPRWWSRANFDTSIELLWWLPQDLFHALPYDPLACAFPNTNRGYPTHAAALDALSAVCLAWAYSQESAS